MKNIIYVIICLSLMSCDPGYNCTYYLKNNTDDTVTYSFYWDQEDTILVEGRVSPDERVYLAEYGTIGDAFYEFDRRAYNLHYNDTVRISVYETYNVNSTNYYTNKTESETFTSTGEYTIIVDSVILGLLEQDSI